MLLDLYKHSAKPPPIQLREQIPKKEKHTLGIDDVRLLPQVIAIAQRQKKQVYCCDPTPEIPPFSLPYLKGSYALNVEGVSVSLSLGRPKHTHSPIQWYTDPTNTTYKRTFPYYAYPQHNTPQTIDIIGAGVTGIVTSYVLAEKGFRIRLFERHPIACAEASGNPHALVYSNLSPFDQIQPRFYQSALFTALHALKGLTQKHSDVFLPCGILSHKKHHEKWSKILSSHDPCIQQKADRLWLPTAGIVQPQNLARAILAHPYIQFFPQHEITGLTIEKGHPTFIAQKKKYRSEHLILCTAHHLKQFALCSSLSVHKSSGQISYTNTPVSSSKYAQSQNSYLTPFWEGAQCFGATYHLRTVQNQVTTADHNENISKLEQLAPDIQVKLHNIYGRSGVRAQTNNFLPIIGPLPDEEWYRDQYSKLKDGLLHSSHYPSAHYIPNMSVHLGHGSKGFSQAWIGAEILASQLRNTPLPVDIDVYQALHPARFLVKTIHRSHPPKT
jgi:tRNA 5-methylaminomethyl-2-thiouridine biosynthesis bifunctional protein